MWGGEVWQDGVDLLDVFFWNLGYILNMKPHILPTFRMGFVDSPIAEYVDNL